MKKSLFLAFLILFSMILVSCTNSGSKIEVSLYKSNSCGCCVNYVAYLERNGFNVRVIDMPNLYNIKNQYGIPITMESCHTMVIGDYFVEGHVPLEAVNGLLRENPDVRGIMLPGMPSASPGMPGQKMGPFSIYSLLPNGKTELFMNL